MEATTRWVPQNSWISLPKSHGIKFPQLPSATPLSSFSSLSLLTRCGSLVAHPLSSAAAPPSSPSPAAAIASVIALPSSRRCHLPPPSASRVPPPLSPATEAAATSASTSLLFILSRSQHRHLPSLPPQQPPLTPSSLSLRTARDGVRGERRRSGGRRQPGQAASRTHGHGGRRRPWQAAASFLSFFLIICYSSEMYNFFF
ncbi:hypothetical protein [Oryza sativa Japonica Group]|uniref:Uncharacterized protein n=1 Tax=Oryza sativa subsp. japonica TaxID=39947 RepID=Q5VP72_ORYSJ|nr:hypothetical protein [Oryza sativa Japonica Group]